MGYTALLFKPAESQPLSLEILNDPRMTAFRESIQHRKKEFGGHEPEIVRRKDRNVERPIQWFTNASGPFSLRPYQNSLAVVRLGPRSIEVQEEPLPNTDYPDHPDLSWSRNPSSYRKRLRDNELANKGRGLTSITDKHRFLISKGLADKNRSSPRDVDFELCDQHENVLLLYITQGLRSLVCTSSRTR